MLYRTYATGTGDRYIIVFSYYKKRCNWQNQSRRGGAVHNLMLYIDSLDKIYYSPLKDNRLVDDTFGKEKYKRIELYGVKKN